MIGVHVPDFGTHSMSFVRRRERPESMFARRPPYAWCGKAFASTNLKTITTGLTGIRAGAEFVLTTMGGFFGRRRMSSARL